MSDETTGLAELTVEVVSSYVANHNIRPEDVPAFIASTHAAIAALTSAPAAPGDAEAKPEYTPAVSARKSLASRDHIISLVDGKPYKTLRRHLATHGLTPDQYRERYGLKADYPMVAPSYSETRKALAQKIGLGRKVKDVAAVVADTATSVVKKVTAPKKETAPKKPRATRKKAAPEAAAA
jgi:predicted transcriptional regulator